MRFHINRHLLRGAVALGVLLGAQWSEAAAVGGTFKYQDTVSPACASAAICPPLQPIAFTQVEIWHHGTMPWDIWAPVGQVTTDGTGRFFFADTRGSGTYAVRVFAMNYAARVGRGGSDLFFAEPGSPGASINKTVTWAGQELDFSFDFVDGSAPLFFNVAETVRRGFDYAAARRDSRETDALVRANFVITDNTGNPNNVSWYNPMLNEVVVHTGSARFDTTILHEYAHWLEAQLSSFAWIALTHDGCTATDIFGALSNSPEHAWMEGFADYFAKAVGLFLPERTLSGLPGASTLEPTPACTVSAADAIEDIVAATLWDLTDPIQAGELHDFVGGADRAIFEIFDRELDTFGHSPTIWDFRNAWYARQGDRAGLDRILSHHRVLHLPLQTAEFAGDSAPAQMIVGTTATVSVRVRNTGETKWSADTLHRLGSQGPQDNAIWGTNRVGLPASVLPGEFVTFSFSAKAPSTPGTYTFQWQMVQDGAEWFGDRTPARSISVITTAPSPDPVPAKCFDPEIRKYVVCY
jgi:hypothetical protein